MEPLTTTWMISSVIASIIGKKSNQILCGGTNHLYKRITSRIDVPANHHIQRAIRKSYLQATHMAVKAVLRNHQFWAIHKKERNNLTTLKSYIEKELNQLQKKDYLPNSVLDSKYRELLFSNDESSENRKQEVIHQLKTSILAEFDRRKFIVPEELKLHIFNGWEYQAKRFDYYDLIAAFFTEELKNNNQLSTFIQTEYLDSISADNAELKIQFIDFQNQLHKSYLLFESVLPKLDNLLAGQEEIKDSLAEIPEKTAQLVLEGIKKNYIQNTREITVSDEYQNRLKAIHEAESGIHELNTQIEGLQNALLQVDESTKLVLQQNLVRTQNQLLEKKLAHGELEEQLNEFVALVLQLAEQLSNSANISSSRLDQAKTLFSNGEYQKLNEVLNESEIDKDIAAYQDKGAQLANELNIKAQTILITKSVGWFKEADRLYLKACSIVNNYISHYNYGNFLDIHNKISLAIEQYSKSLNLVSDKEKKAELLSLLANLYAKQNDYTLAESSIEDSLDIWRQLAEENPNAHQSNLANALNHKANFFWQRNELRKSKETHSEALKIKRGQVEEGESTYLADLAKFINDFGVTLMSSHEFADADKFYQESLNIRQKLADKNPSKNLPAVIISLNNIGLSNYKQENFSNSLEAYKKAIEINRDLAAQNPHRHLPLLSKVLHNQGMAQLSNNELIEAEKSYNEAIDISKNLAKQNPNVYKPNIADYTYSLAITKTHLGQLEEAEKLFFEVLEIRKQLAESLPKKFEISLADSHIALASIYKDFMSNKVASKSNAQKAAALYKKYADEVPYAKEWYENALQYIEYWETESESI